ncbi:MAG: signal peptide peptidase SppA, partial [Candidatus Sericytochromatia bacterium]
VNEELRRKLEKFKKSGKKVVAYIYSADIKDYYLASVADHIIIHPSGELQFQGVGSLNYFYKGLMDKVGVESQFQKYGKYKSAVESSTRYSGSDEDKEQRLALMKQFYSSVENAVTSSRKLTPQDLQTIVDNKLLMSSRESKELKLVDEIGYYDQVPELLGKYTQNQKIKKYGIVDIDRRVYKEYAWADDYKVAVVNASGAIVEGSSTSDFLSGESSMGADTIVKLLEKVRNADDVKAVVLRVDSGGGSSLASDIIGREVKRFKEVGKPIVVSMGNVAASGGYWIATDADKVLANQNTITGSIGVFTGKMNFDKLFSKLGINVEAIKIGKHADAFSEHRPFSDEELKILDKSAQEIYRMFLERVSSGRKIEISKVEALAQGRVYSGEEAKKLNLIDQIGGLEEAVEIAKELAKIKDKNVKVLNARLSEVEMMSSNPIQETLASFYPY